MYPPTVHSLNFYPVNWLLIFLLPVILLPISCGHTQPVERYGFVARLGNDTVSIESVTKQGNTITSDEVDRFPRVRLRHTEIELASDGSIRHLVMDIHTPSEPPQQRERKVIANITKDSVHISKTDSTGTLHRDFATGGSIVVAHIEQMYSLYELYFAAALKHTEALKSSAGKPVEMRQFYIDREFDRFPLGNALVQPLANGKAEITHDWLSGTGEVTIDTSHHMLSYSGAQTTYKVEVKRLSSQPDIKSIADRFEAAETKSGKVKQMSVRDTLQAQIGNAKFIIEYGRPLMRGRKLLGDVIPYDDVWRTGANAATQFTTSAPITLAGMRMPAGAYTLWTIPHKGGVDLIVNKETGQWGTEYDDSKNLGIAKMTTNALTMPVEEFTISIVTTDTQHGTLVIEWGSFKWSAPIQVQ